jgi:hypothetical protein
MNLRQQFKPQGSELPAARDKVIEQQFYPNMNLASDGFEIWWHKTFAQHTAMVAQASALMRAHRRVSAANESRASQAH